MHGSEANSAAGRDMGRVLWGGAQTPRTEPLAAKSVGCRLLAAVPLSRKELLPQLPTPFPGVQPAYNGQYPTPELPGES